MKHYCLELGTFKLDGGAMFGIIPKPLWNKSGIADEQNRILLTLRVQLIQTDHHLILIDTGIGDYHNEKFQTQFAVRVPESPFATVLKTIGKKVEDVTDIVLTHLHFDHAGGLGKLVPVFPKARLHLHQKHYTYGLQASERDQGSFLLSSYGPTLTTYIQNSQVNWVQGESGTLIQDGNYSLRFLTTQGHTPHLMHPYDENYIYLADIVPTSMHLKPAWVMGYDMAPGISTQDKTRIYKHVLDKNLKLIFEHDPKYWGATLGRDSTGNVGAQMLWERPLKDTEHFGAYPLS